MTILTACRQEPTAFAEEKALPEQTLLNIAYGPDSLQKMDVHLPADRSAAATKSLVLIHGGGWTSGSKAEFAPYLDSFKKRLPGYALFTLNYRLANGTHLFPSQENDIKAALDFIAANAGNYHIENDNFSLLGFSAGAHLALLQAYKYKSPKIRAVVDYFGPTDLVTMYNKPWHPLVPLALQMVTGATPQQNIEIYEQSSPSFYVTAEAPPTLLLHGGRDVVVDVSQSKLLAEKLGEKGVAYQLHVYPNEGHGRWYGHSLVSSFDHIEQFLKTHTD